MTGVPLCTINAYFITYYQELKVQYYFMQVKYELLDLNELKFLAMHQIILLQIIYTSINKAREALLYEYNLISNLFHRPRHHTIP